MLAEAVQALYPGTQVTIGPAIENGFYYDFYRNEPFTPADLPAIEAKMREIIAANAPFTREEWDRDEAIAFFEERGERFKAELIRDLPASETITIYRQGEWLDLCRARICAVPRILAPPSSCKRPPAPIGAAITATRC